MAHRNRSAPPSKREIAFRFVACTGIALALYYTPELKWDASASAALAMEMDADPALGAPDMPREACARLDDSAALIDASIRGN